MRWSTRIMWLWRRSRRSFCRRKRSSRSKWSSQFQELEGIGTAFSRKSLCMWPNSGDNNLKPLDRYSILDQTPSGSGVPAPASAAKEESVSPSTPRFPADDSSKSLTEMAQRDLEAALQLLAERAQYITGASGAAIAL